MQFADVKNDIAFRKIFGNENRKGILISFLNAVLEFQGRDIIVKIDILDPYQLPKLNNRKVTIIDVKATDQSGKTYIVEMQVVDKEAFDKRVLYYCSKAYTDQINRGDFYRQLKPVIFIGILNFSLTINKNFISRSQIRDIETGQQTIGDLEFTFIELPKFVLTEDKLETLTEKWIYFIKNAESLKIVPNNVDDIGLQNAYQDANQHTWTKEELAAYDYVFMREADERGRFEKAVRIATEKATKETTKRVEKETTERVAKETAQRVEKETAQRVEKETHLETAKKMKVKGIDVKAIADITGLTVAEISTL